MKLITLILIAAAAFGDTTPDDEPGRDRSTEMIVVELDGSSEWYVINDGVMGGISRGSFAAADGTAVFAGELSLERNGGFASVRTDLGTTDLSGWVGLEVRVRGDGRTYQLRLRTDGRFDGLAYRASFATRAGEWTTARLPFAQFAPTFRGRIIADAPALDTARIRQLGFLLADKQPGPFRLEIANISAWRGPED